ncbi:Hypothetical predicted protein [Paramuricea clavata]|uniref:Uncharacterized protein n=1 Tax=Paramuricea clavata TaxID=317549 RepID=A0A6S7G7W0_PARCT|nr:Hypothetical predicted protein [Paramuricea clavata]
MSIQILENPAIIGNKRIKSLVVDDDVWFVAGDVADALGYKDTDKAVRNHVDPESRKAISDISTPAKTAGVQISYGSVKPNTTMIDEAGMYELIMRSKLPAARAFSRWIAKDVLPDLFENVLILFLVP